jgi:hypothetical protein
MHENDPLCKLPFVIQQVIKNKKLERKQHSLIKETKNMASNNDEDYFISSILFF